MISSPITTECCLSASRAWIAFAGDSSLGVGARAWHDGRRGVWRKGCEQDKVGQSIQYFFVVKKNRVLVEMLRENDSSNANCFGFLAKLFSKVYLLAVFREVWGVDKTLTGASAWETVGLWGSSVAWAPLAPKKPNVREVNVSRHGWLEMTGSEW